jgi:hypothetical protein
MENSDIESLHQVLPTSSTCPISVTTQDVARICFVVEADNLFATLETYFRAVMGFNIIHGIGWPQGA